MGLFLFLLTYFFPISPTYKCCFSIYVADDNSKVEYLFYRFNKREEDFPSLREYNDYLEEVEDMSEFLCFFFQWLLSIVFNSRFYLDQKKKFFFLTVFDLVAGVDVPAIEEKIAEYQKENADLILINQARKVLSGILLFLLLKQQS